MRALDRKLDAFAAMLADRRAVAGRDNISRHHDLAGTRQLHGWNYDAAGNVIETHQHKGDFKEL